MNGLKAKGKTIGEVEKLTGISKRDLKYFIEQGLSQPSLKSESGYWLYSDDNIQRVQLISLCRALDFPVSAIRTILIDPEAHWSEELERQILRLTTQRDRIAVQLCLAQRLRYSKAEEALQIHHSEQTQNELADLARNEKMEV